MLVYFTDAITNNQVAINPKFVTAVFIVSDGGEHDGKTALNTLTGTLVVTQSQIEVVGTLNGELND